MAFVAGPAFVVDQNAAPDWSGALGLTDLRVTPGGGFQIVWDTSSSTSGETLHQTSYRIFDPAGQPLTDEIAGGGYYGGDPAIHLQQSIELDDGTILKVDTVYSQTGPGSWLVLQLYGETGVPVGAPILTTPTFSAWWGSGLAQLPNRDIVFVAQSSNKLGEGYIFSWVLDNTSPDLYAPVLTGIAGADGAPEVMTDGTIFVAFNELIELAPWARIDLKTSGGELVDSFEVSDGADMSAWVSSLAITPAVTLDPATEYVLEFAAGSVLDPSGNAFAGGAFHFTTAGGPSPPPPPPPPAGGDTTAPLVIDFFPGAGTLPVDWSPGITFNEEVRAGPGTITLETDAGQVVQTFSAGDPGLQFLGASVLIDPAADLLPGTTYRLVVEADAFQDLAGNAAVMCNFSFTTAAEPPAAGDTTPPSVFDWYPMDPLRLPVDWSPAVTFTEPVQPGAGTITLRTAAGEVVQTFSATDPGIQFFGASVLIDPAADLLPGTTYTLTASAGAFQDLAGNASRLSTISFTTAGEPAPAGDTTAPVAIDFFPAPGSNTLPPDWSPGINFNESVKAGSGTITLQTAAGEVVQTFSATDPGIRFFDVFPAPGSDTRVLIDPAADLLPGTTYRLIIGPGAFEDLAGNAYAGVSDYSFTTAAPPPPPAAPVLVYFYPEIDKIMFDHSPGLVFNEPVKLGSGIITLETTAGEVVQAFPSFGLGGGITSGTKVFIDPTADLELGTSYRLIVGPNALQDLDGNPYPGMTSEPFTAVTRSAIRVVNVDPAPGSNTVPPDGNLSITFDGPVKPGSGGLTLMSTQGDFREIFVTATDPGVQFIGSTLVIDPAVDLQPGTEYRAGFGSDAVEDLAGNFVGVPDFFFTTALVGVPPA